MQNEFLPDGLEGVLLLVSCQRHAIWRTLPSISSLLSRRFVPKARGKSARGEVAGPDRPDALSERSESKGSEGRSRRDPGYALGPA